MPDKMSIKNFLSKFDAGEFSSPDRDTQCAAGWYDWFCKDSFLRSKTYALTAKLKSIVNSPKINKDTMYVFFKNNCPLTGPLYDDFRICDIETGDVIWTVTPSRGDRCPDCGGWCVNGKAELYGRENSFASPLAKGTWKDIRQYFFEEVSEMKATYGKPSKAKVISAWPFLSSAGTTTYETQLHEDGVLTCNCPGWVRHVLNGQRGCKHVRGILPIASEIMSSLRKPEFIKSESVVSPKPKVESFPRKDVEEIRSSRRLLRVIPE